MKSIGEPFLLLFLAIKLYWFNRQEEKKIRRYFYTQSPIFARFDSKLLVTYRKESPYNIVRNFLEKQGKSSTHTYGETPLSVLYKALISCGISSSDCFIDLGCGRGRTALFVASWFGCKAIGIDEIPTFIEKAKSIQGPCAFLKQDMRLADLQAGTILYFYALCLEDVVFYAMIEKLRCLKAGTLILTPSFPLSDYSKGFSTCSFIKANYPWGKTHLYVNCVSPQK